MSELSPKVAMVTGAGTGIGKHSALALARLGYSVVLAGRRRELLEGVGRDVEALGVASLVVGADVGQPEEVNKLFQKTAETFGRLDLLFNNAGIGAPPVALEELTFAQWKAVVDINLTGSFLCTQHAMRAMKTQAPMGGRIINNGSLSAHAPRPNSAPYTSTKHAITGLTKSTSLDGRAFNIVCSQIDIGNAETEMTARMIQGVPQANGQVEVEPTMDAENVANTVALIANMPLDANVQFVTVMATKMPFIGRG